LSKMRPHPPSATNRRVFLLGASALTCLATAGGRAHATPAVSGADDVRALTAAYNASGHRLVGALAESSGNIVLSPYSIGAAMAMALAGARGATEAELARALAFALSQAQLEAASGAAMARLLGYDSSHDPRLCPEGMTWTGDNCQGRPDKDGCPRGVLHDGKCAIGPIVPFVRLSVANALMLGKEFGDFVSDDYRTLVRDRFAAEIFTGASLADVNDWVRQKTDGKIDRILDKLDKLSVAVLLNAIYLRAAWAAPFKKSETADRDFNLSSKDRIKAPTMTRGSAEPIVRGPGFRAIRLPLAAPQLGLIIVLPNDIDGLVQVSRSFDSAMQADLFRAFDGKEPSSGALSLEAKGVSPLALPKFKAALAADLAPPFQKLGLTLALSNDADFSGMTGGRKKVKIDQIRHRAIFEAAEDGIEAAAATAVEIGVAGAAAHAPPPREPFIVDRPFMFFLADQATGAVLFEGMIVDPTKSA